MNAFNAACDASQAHSVPPCYSKWVFFVLQASNRITAPMTGPVGSPFLSPLVLVTPPLYCINYTAHSVVMGVHELYQELVVEGKIDYCKRGYKNSHCTALKSNVSQDSVLRHCVNYMISATIRSARAHPVVQERSMNNHPQSTNLQAHASASFLIPP